MATSYTNPDGSGNRTATITVVSSGWANSAPSTLVNGNTTENVGWFGGNSRIEFTFLAAKVIDEAKFYQQDATTHGVWKWQGSNDGSTWTDIGGSFTLGGSALQTQTTLAGNTSAYIKYRLEKVSGTTSAGPYIREFEFKIDEPVLVASAARVTQAVVETLSVLSGPAAAARVSHLAIETLSLPAVPVTGDPARVTQHALELFHVTAAAARTTQHALEVFFPLVVPVRTTQTVLEWFQARTAEALRTQTIVEVFLVAGCTEEYPKLPECGSGDYPVLPSEDCMDASTFVVNMALQEIGISKQVGNMLTDVTQEALCARLVFMDVVDTVLRDHPWKFATEYAALAWEAGTPAAPVHPDWVYRYALPGDCVRVRRVCDPSLQRRYTTTPVPFDLRASPDGVRDVLLCNEPGAGQLPLVDPPTVTIEYTKRFACPGQVNDAQFRECLVMKLAARMAKALARDSKDADRALRNYSLALPKAQTQHANDQERQRPIDGPPDWIAGR